MRRYLTLIKIAGLSLMYRKSAVTMTVLSVATSIFVLLGVEHIRKEVRENFTGALSGIDLIAGPRTGQVNLLLYSIFRIGNPSNSISWASVQAISNHPNVKWTIPISLGDSHNGFRLMGTSAAFFEHYHYRSEKTVQFDRGHAFASATDVVLGASVASALNYAIGDEIVFSHGIAKHSFSTHDDHPFRVVGILKPTGSAVDSALYTQLEGIERIHKGEHADSLTPDKITAVMLGLNSKLATFKVQRWINGFDKEPLSAILPGVALIELWQLMGTIEQVLLFISALIFVAALFGIAAMLLSAIRERKQELFIFRSLGASPTISYVLLTCEAMLILLVGAVLAITALLIGLALFNSVFSHVLGMAFSLNLMSVNSLVALAAMFVSVLLICILPAVSIYKLSRPT